MIDVINQKISHLKSAFTPPYSTKNIKTIGFTLSLLLLLPIIIIAVQTEVDNRSRAAENKGLEAESCVKNGSVVEKTDSAASGGKYIQFTFTSSTQPSPTGSNRTPSPSPTGTRR